jgi:hypothetical protein
MGRSGDAFAACLDEARGLSLHTPHCAVDGKQAGDRELVRLLDEQAALRRVATLVARATDRLGVVAAVAEEVGRLLTWPMPPTVTATSPRSAATTSPGACGGPLPRPLQTTPATATPAAISAPRTHVRPCLNAMRATLRPGL